MPQDRQFSTPVFVLLIFAFAFALRACFALQWQDMPYGAAPQLDADAYDKWAWSLAQGARDKGVFYQSPLYPYLLSWLYRMTGHDYLAVSLFNAVLDSTTVVILGLVARLIFGDMAAIATAVLAACSAPMVFYTAPVMKEPLALLLLALFLLTALHALRGVRWRPYLFCGFIFGLAVLVRGNVLLMAAVMPVFAWMRYRRRALCATALFALGVIVAFSPVVWHNARVADDFVPIAYDDGFNLYIGHSPTANGTNAYPPEVSTGPEQERIDVTWSAERQTGHSLKPSQVSAFWRDRAVDYAVTHPAREAELLGRKFLAFWNNADRFDNYDPSFIRRTFPSVLNGLVVSFAVIAALAAFAAVCCWPARGYAQDDRVFLIACAVCYMISVLAFYVTDRYRLPVLVFLLPLAGAALPGAIVAYSQKQYKRLAAAAGLAALFVTIALLPPLDAVDITAFDWAALAAMCDDEGSDDDALRAFYKALALSPRGAGVQAYEHAATVYDRRGQSDQAEQWIKTAAAVFPEDGIALYNLGRIQAGRGAIDQALATMLRAQTLMPTYGLTYYALARLYAKKRDAVHEREAIEQGLAVNPNDDRLLALTQKRQGDETK